METSPEEGATPSEDSAPSDSPEQQRRYNGFASRSRSPMKILVVEDEPKTATSLRRRLGEYGYVVDLATDGADGLHLATTAAYDLVILDVQLPHWDGWSILTRMRKEGRQTPVLFLTARDTIADRVKGLELGADDYLVKPFAFSELLARVRTVLRRGQARQEETLRVGDLEVDILRHKVTRAGQRIELSAKEFGVLALLARRPGEILSRIVIAEQVWDMNFDSDTNVVDVAIRRLRVKVDEPFTTRLIHSVRGAGYVLDEQH